MHVHTLYIVLTTFIICDGPSVVFMCVYCVRVFCRGCSGYEGNNVPI